MKKVLSIIFISGLVVFSCKKEKSEEPEEPTTTTTDTSFKFAADVQPIFNASCAVSGCHSTSIAADGKVYETHAGAIAVSDSQTLGAIKHLTSFKAMPQGGAKLSDFKIATIEGWINAGKPND